MANWKDFVDPDARGGRFLPWKEVARATGLSRTTAWRLQKRHEFPAPYVISPGRVGYLEDEVEAWQASCGHSAARRGGAPRGARPEGADARKARPTPSSGEDRSPPPEPPGPARQSRPSPAAETRPLPPPARPGRARRRSQHAQAIAQQMRFDF